MKHTIICIKCFFSPNQQLRSNLVDRHRRHMAAAGSNRESLYQLHLSDLRGNIMARHGLRRCVRARTCAMCVCTCACACEMTFKICVQCACVRALLSWSHTTHMRPHLTTNLRWSHFTPCTRTFCKLTFFQQFLGVPKQNRMF